MNAPFDPAKLPASAPTTVMEAPSDVTLSICVPTYNRARFLEHLFPHLAEASQAFDFTYEIVVSDNASPDDTATVVERFQADGLPIRYFRQEENKVLSNLLSAFHHARGRYLVYLADDDLIVPEALADNIRFMLANPEIRACYTPWDIYDDVNKASHQLFYQLDTELAVFHPGQEVDLLNMLVKNHIIPEIAIYRADAVRCIVSAPRFCYWAFSYLATIAAQGPIAFRQMPYYRSVTLSPVMPNRSQEGTADNLSNWDSFRGGIEYMIFSLLRRHNVTPDAEVRLAFRDMVDSFLQLRMRVTLRLWLGRRDYIRAYEILCRLNYLNPNAIEGIDNLEKLSPLIMAQTLARLANGIAGIDRVVLAGIGDSDAVGTMLRDLGLEERIRVEAASDAPDEGARTGCLVFIGQEDLRQDFVDQGYEPGLIVSERNISANILI